MATVRGSGSNAILHKSLRSAVRSAVTEAVKSAAGQFTKGRRPGQTPPGQGRRARRSARRLAANAALRSVPRNKIARPERFSRGAPQLTSQFAVRGHGYYDAFVQRPEAMVLAAQVGPCTPVEGFARTTLPGHAGVVNVNNITDNTTLLVFNPGTSDNIVGRIYRLRVSPTAEGEVEVFHEDIGVTAFAEFSRNSLRGPSEEPLDSTGSVESIPLRGSVRIRNVTENYAVGGEVRLLRYNGGLAVPEDMDVTDYLDICDMIRDSKRAQTLSGEEMQASQQSNTYPADHVRSMTFTADTPFDEAVLTPSYCTLLVMVENFQAGANLVNNTYSVGLTVHRAARFRPGTLLHSKAVTPASNPQVVGVHTRREAVRVDHVSPVSQGLRRLTQAAPFALAGGMAAKQLAGVVGKAGMPWLESMLPEVGEAMLAAAV